MSLTLIDASAAPGGAPVEDLRAAFSGRVSTPADADWDAERAAWALNVDQRPALVVRPRDERDVVAAVRFAAAAGLRIAAQGTGHNAAPLGDLAGTMLVRTDLMRGVRIDPVAKSARVDAGALWQDVTVPAAEHGLAALAGSSPDVGVVGYTLGGGVSWLARSHGLAANSVTAVELVTPDGVLRRVDESTDRELFWALRGGGGAFGVVTAMEFRLYPITAVHAGALFWPVERAAEVMNAWRAWTDELPASVTSLVRVLNLPPIPDVPEPLRGRSFAIVEAVFQDAAPVADAILADLRRLEPELDTFAQVSPLELSHLHMDPPGPVPCAGGGALLTDLTSDAIDAVLSIAASAQGRALASTEIRHLGGALAPGRSDGGVVSGLDGSFLLFTVGMAETRDAERWLVEVIDALVRSLAPWRSPWDYLNFVERPVDARRLFGPDLDQLAAIADRVDPRGLMRSNHPVTRRIDEVRS
jgi:hypothetical protein